jgi:hypothetical protein
MQVEERLFFEKLEASNDGESYMQESICPQIASFSNKRE